MTPATAQASDIYPEQRDAAAHLSPPSNQGFEPSAQAEIRVSGHSIDSFSGGADLLLPFVDEPQDLLFTQWGLHRKQQATTLNAGIGYRWFPESQEYWGTNLFYDRQFPNAYHRWGLGIEQCNRNSKITLNSYFPNRARSISLDKSTTEAAPAFGLDLRYQYQIPTLPHWRVNLQTERYWGNIIVSKGETVENHATMTLGVDYTPIPLVTVGYGFCYDNSRQKAHQLHLQLNCRFGVPLSQQLNPQQVAANGLLNLDRLALVQRNHQIILKKSEPKKSEPKKSNLKQQSNAVHKLKLPTRWVGAPSTRHIIRFELMTPSPHDQWKFASSGSIVAAGGKVVLAGEDSIAVTLPRSPGLYTFRLHATNQQGASVTSNLMSIHVTDEPKRSPRFDPPEPPKRPQAATWKATSNWKATSKPDQRMKNIFTSSEEIAGLENACAVLGIPCSPASLSKTIYKKTFAARALASHSDKTGVMDHAEFVVIQPAYETLTAADKKYHGKK